MSSDPKTVTGAMSEITDEILAEHVQHGDKSAFGVIVERYEAKLRRYGTKFLADHEDVTDIVQDVFLSVYQHILSYDPEQRFSPWIYRIAHNAFVNALKKRSRSHITFLDLDTLLSYPADEDPAVRDREEKEMRALIDKGLEAIPAKYREVLLLYYLEEMQYKEIADILQVPIGTVGIRVKRGKKALKEAYQSMHIEYEI